MRDPAKRLASKAAYRERRREELASKQRKYRAENLERVRLLEAAYREANRDEVLARKKEYYRRNPDKRSANRARRRALERGAAGEASAEAIEQRRRYYGFVCWVCGGEADAVDHVLALCRGGTAWPANLRPICTGCNLSKLVLDKAGSPVVDILAWAKDRRVKMDAARSRMDRMGTTKVREAAAVTPRLFLGDHLSIPHTYLYGDGSDLVRRGHTVRVDSDEWALITLLNLGVPFKEATTRINEAKYGLAHPDPAIPRSPDHGREEVLQVQP